MFFNAIPAVYSTCAGVARETIGLLLLASGEQVGDGDSQGLSQEEGFLVGDASDACLDLGQGSPGDVQARPLAFGGEVLLRDVEAVSKPADLLSHDVRGH